MAGKAKIQSPDQQFGSDREKALEDGVDPRTVWFALCRAQDVPESRWWGVDRPPRD